MKTFFVTPCLIAAALPVAAQLSTPPSGMPSQPPSRLEFLTTYLSLTSSQQLAVKTIFDAEEAAAKTAMTSLQTAQDALTAADKQGQSDYQLDQLAATVGARFGDLAAIHAKAEAKFYAILTSDQQAKYDKLFTMGLSRAFAGH
jgi:Spy/CpxP family protein refolding chaperone